jgi:hypothetical protein
MRSFRAAAVLAALAASALPSAPAAAGGAQHCVSWLQPTSVHGTVIEAEEVELGCYPTYAEALEAATGVVLDDSVSPASVTDGDLGGLSASSVVIGTEWVETGYTSTSKTYTATVTCSSSVSWEVAYVTDTWNDKFESGKGFGGCDRNRKFQHSQFGGTSVLCTPNCSTYGSLNNEVSSLRWTH